MGYDIEMMGYNAETIQYAFMSIRIAAEKIGFKVTDIRQNTSKTDR